MAQRVTITDGPGTALQLIIDGHEMTEVLSYKVERECGRCTLTLVTEIMEKVETAFDKPM